jgi:hypothetical protein
VAKGKFKGEREDKRSKRNREISGERELPRDRSANRIRADVCGDRNDQDAIPKEEIFLCDPTVAGEDGRHGCGSVVPHWVWHFRDGTRTRCMKCDLSIWTPAKSGRHYIPWR